MYVFPEAGKEVGGGEFQKLITKGPKGSNIIIRPYSRIVGVTALGGTSCPYVTGVTEDPLDGNRSPPGPWKPLISASVNNLYLSCSIFALYDPWLWSSYIRLYILL